MDGSTSLTIATGAALNGEVSGYIECYGYHATAGGWFFSGWITNRPDILDRLNDVTAWFGDDRLSGPATPLFFARDDVRDGAVGFLIFLCSDETPQQELSCIRIGTGPKEQAVSPVINAPNLPAAKLKPLLDFIITKSLEGPQRFEMERLMTGVREISDTGYTEYFGYHQAAGGWFVNGWVAGGWGDGQDFDRIVLSFEKGDVRGQVVATAYPRADLPDGAYGVILFLKAPPGPFGQLLSVSLFARNAQISLTTIADAPQCSEAELTTRLKASLATIQPDLSSERLANLLSRRAYAGQHTHQTLSPAIRLQVDEAIRCGTSGLVLIGWVLAKPGETNEIRLRCGALNAAVVPSAFLKVERPDVLAGLAGHGFEDSACGFVAYVAGAIQPDAPIYLEIETRRYQRAFHNVPEPVRTGMTAIKHLLTFADARFADIQPAFDRVIGPAIDGLNQGRLAAPAGCQVVDYGSVPESPEFSVVVPLHGRLDFAEYQLALFSAQPNCEKVEFIYVLDDPPKRREAQGFFAAIYERFKIPFRAVLLEQNLGFAPANNAGLRYAAGRFIAYLNSDVFPGTLDWLERLSAHFDNDPQLGVIGPQLIFEDGTVQHRGMYFEKLAEYGDWYFCQHHDKGLRYSGGAELQYFPAITGACMVLRRETAVQLGGFDETYIIGDFEDSEMCLKLLERGLKCAVDPTVQLYHIERKSQLSGAVGWRANLTAYNAWQHNRRWRKTIESLPPGNAGRLS